MPYINKIPLSKVKIIPSLQHAAIGTLLQIATGTDSPVAGVGLRCALPVAGGQSTGVVFLEGASVGLFLTDEELKFAPALDISKLARVVLDEPAPRNNMKVVAGDVYQTKDRTNNASLGIAVCLPNSPTVLLGFAPLEGRTCGQITTVAEQVYVGKAAVVPLDEPST